MSRFVSQSYYELLDLEPIEVNIFRGVSPEDVAANLDRIRSEDGYVVPFSSQDEFAKLGPRLLG